eukprot:6193719-Pleurochrysis_carterae.AAC.1
MEPTRNARTTRSRIAAAREKMVNELKAGMMVAILLNVGIERDYEPWLRGRLCGPARQALASDVAQAAKLSFKISSGQQVIELQNYEPFAHGSREFAECNIRVIAPLSSLCHHDITLAYLEKVQLASAHLEKDTTRYTQSASRQSPCDSPARSLGCARWIIRQTSRQVDNTWAGEVEGWDRASDNTWKVLAETNDEQLLAQARACLERQDAERRAKDATFEEEMNRERERAAAARRGSGVDGSDGEDGDSDGSNGDGGDGGDGDRDGDDGD